MNVELLLSVFAMLVLAFVGGHQLAVHRMMKRRQSWAPPKPPPAPLPDPPVLRIECDASQAMAELAKVAAAVKAIPKPPRQTGRIGTPADRIPLRKPSRGNGHETPYARKKRAAKGKA